MNKHIIIDNVKLTTSDNPTITVNRSYVQLVKNIVPKYRTCSVDEVPSWSIYSRKHKRMTSRPVALSDIPQLIVEWNDQYGPDTYNAYPRGNTRKPYHHYYATCTYEGEGQVGRLSDKKPLVIYNNCGERIWLRSKRYLPVASYIRHRLFSKQHGEVFLNLDVLDSMLYNRVRRLYHDGR